MDFSTGDKPSDTRKFPHEKGNFFAHCFSLEAILNESNKLKSEDDEVKRQNFLIQLFGFLVHFLGFWKFAGFGGGGGGGTFLCLQSCPRLWLIIDRILRHFVASSGQSFYYFWSPNMSEDVSVASKLRREVPFVDCMKTGHQHDLLSQYGLHCSHPITLPLVTPSSTHLFCPIYSALPFHQLSAIGHRAGQHVDRECER